MIDDAARALGKCHRCAHAFDVGGKPAIKGERGLADQLGRFLNRRVEIDFLTFDLGAGLRQLTLETGDRLGAAVLEHLEPLVGALD